MTSKVSEVDKFIETESKIMVTRGWGRKKGGLLFKECSSTLQDENVPEICFTTLWLYLTPLNCTLKNSEDGKFYVMCFLPQ